jgi:hypothetical protein
MVASTAEALDAFETLAPATRVLEAGAVLDEAAHAHAQALRILA